jgi:hypothetical protein
VCRNRAQTPLGYANNAIETGRGHPICAWSWLSTFLVLAVSRLSVTLLPVFPNYFFLNVRSSLPDKRSDLHYLCRR